MDDIAMKRLKNLANYWSNASDGDVLIPHNMGYDAFPNGARFFNELAKELLYLIGKVDSTKIKLKEATDNLINKS